MLLMEPDVARSREGIQLSYGLPYRLNDACIYPKRSSNGSLVVVCVHENGLRLVWHGGRRHKEDSQAKVNGNSIDLTEDEGSKIITEYEEEEDEIDPMQPFHQVLTYNDVIFDTAACKLATLPSSTGYSDHIQRFLDVHIVVAVACADLSLRLVVLPLDPKKEQNTKVQQIVIAANNSHQDLISAVALTVTATGHEAENVKSQSRSRSRDHNTRESENPSQEADEWSFLLASTSATGTGLLLIHQIAFTKDGQISDNDEDLFPIHRQFLRCPVARCRLEFNPSPYPSHRHVSLLIASSDSAATKIYQALPRKAPAKKRKDSNNTIGSTASAAQHARRSNIADSVLLDLLLPFRRTNDAGITPARKRVVDARWVLQGRAILALLDDGEWGIWDIEAAGPTTSSSASNLVKGQSNITGLIGGSVTRFAMRGSVGTGTASKRSTIESTKSGADSSLMPMTPHTRKSRQQDLFKGQDDQSTPTEESSERTKNGSIAVCAQSKTTAGIRAQDESVLLNYGATNTFIPSLQMQWRTGGSDKGSLEGATNAKPATLPHLRTAGEEVISIHLLPSTQHSSDEFDAGSRSVPDFVAVTPSRLILYVAPLTDPNKYTTSSLQPTRLFASSSAHQDQMLLDSGELDVDGMDRMLDNMANGDTPAGSRSLQPTSHFGRKSVGFQLEGVDEDVDMSTPTASKGPRSRLLINSATQRSGARRLFI